MSRVTGRPGGRPPGHKLSPESRDRISAGMRRRWAIKFGELFPCACGVDCLSAEELAEHSASHEAEVA